MTPMPKPKPPAFTVTGEIYQPARLHFTIRDPRRLPKALDKLHSLRFDHAHQCWVWLHKGDPSRLKFVRPEAYPLIPNETLVLATIRLSDRREMHVDTISFERAIAATELLARHIPRNVAELQTITVVNRLFDPDTTPEPDDIFAAEPTIVDPNASFAALRAISAETDDPNERGRQFSELIANENRKPLPELERFPANFYDDGIVQLRAALTIRQAVAAEHWKGNTTATIGDMIEKFLAR